jgi:hypothetical protein
MGFVKNDTICVGMYTLHEVNSVLETMEKMTQEKFITMNGNATYGSICITSVTFRIVIKYSFSVCIISPKIGIGLHGWVH